MKYKLKYSPDASDKLRNLNKQITDSNGKQVATRIVSKTMGEIRGLQNNPEKGPSVEALLGIPTFQYLKWLVGVNFRCVRGDTLYVRD